MTKKLKLSTLAVVGIFAATLAFGSVALAFTGTGAGTEGDPYQITSCVQLQEMNDEPDAHYILNNDIDCSDTVNWNAGAGFEPVGNTFTGVFDGQEFAISDLYINRPSTGDIGLFNTIGETATIQNVTLVDVSITASGDYGVGGLAGNNSGTIENSSVSGSVTTDFDSVGGLVGFNFEGTIRNSHADVTVTGGSSIGGLVGLNLQGTIEKSYATGNVTGGVAAAGGLIGENYGPVTDSYATGDVDGSENVGGLVGYNGSCVCGGVARSYSVGSVSGDVGVGGLIGDGSSDAAESFWDTQTSGQASSDSGTGKTTAEMKDILTFSSATWDIQTTSTNLNNGYPFLSWQAGASSPVWYVYISSDSDSDGDSVPDEVEDAGPNGGDANNDGTLDSQQGHVASFINTGTGTYAVLEADSVCDFTTVGSSAESANTVADSGFNYPAGLMSFILNCGTPGYTTTITQYYYGVTNDGFILRKHNPNTNAYFTISGATLSQIAIGGQTATKAEYQATDGGDLDTDNTANGIIVDPVGLAQSAAGAPNTGLGRVVRIP